jgi:hypothetical protein
LNITEDGTVIDMTFYVEKLLEGLTVAKMLLPGNHSSLIVGEDVKLLNEGDRKFYIRLL